MRGAPRASAPVSGYRAKALEARKEEPISPAVQLLFPTRRAVKQAHAIAVNADQTAAASTQGPLCTGALSRALSNKATASPNSAPTPNGEARAA